MSRWWTLALMLGATGCEESIYGTADVYVYNGTDVRRTITIDGGRESHEFLLRSGTGKFFDNEVAGDRTFTIRSDSGSLTVLAPLEKETFNVLNVDGAGCFARADVSGMYIDGRRPVKLS
ncbi:MAG: hypothetical protein AAFQ82_10250, partial [Myxococcota bacterium]